MTTLLFGMARRNDNYFQQPQQTPQPHRQQEPTQAHAWGGNPLPLLVAKRAINMLESMFLCMLP
jgi:hypothetical protein